MEIVSIVEFMISKVYRKSKFSRFEDSEALNLIIQVLCFIMEKSLLEEPCTKDDISAFIRTLDIEFFKKQIPDEDYLNLTDYVIRDCLQNGGVPYTFKTYNCETGKEVEIDIKLIDDQRIVEQDMKLYSYYMTPQGYKFLFNTLEIEESMQVSIEQFKLSIAIKKRNFGTARNNVDQLFNLCRSQVQKINYLIKQINEDVYLVGIEEYGQIYRQTFDTLKEQKAGHDSLYDLIDKTEQEILEQAGMKLTQEIEEDIEHINYIKQRLKYIISEQTKLLLKQQELSQVYNEAIDNILSIGFENRINLEKTLLETIEENPHKVNAIAKILKPLFMPSPEKIFNINLAYKEQRIEFEGEESQDDGVIRSDKNMAQGESETKIRVRAMNDHYSDILGIIFDFIIKAKGTPIKLSDIIAELKQDGDLYKRFVPQTRTLLTVLLQLYNVRKVDVAKILGGNRRSIYNPSEEFDIKFTLLELVQSQKVYQNIQWMEATVDANETVSIEELGILSEDIPFRTVEALVCPEMIFRAEVKNIG